MNYREHQDLAADLKIDQFSPIMQSALSGYFWGNEPLSYQMRDRLKAEWKRNGKEGVTFDGYMKLMELIYRYPIENR
jgi:uncharacterized membrane protein YcgQ (UPF0703/DUF1980 family)